MDDQDPNLDLPEIDEKEGFPWIPIVTVIAVIAAAAMWIIHGKSYRSGHDTTVAALEQQLAADKAELDTEKDKVFDMTSQLDALKQGITMGTVPDRQKAKAEYNKLAAQQNSQREKVKQMADRYNEKVAKLHAMQ